VPFLFFLHDSAATAIYTLSYTTLFRSERGTIGGTCVNIGCVPSKTLLRAGEIRRLALRNPFDGLRTSAGPVDLQRLVEQKDELVDRKSTRLNSSHVKISYAVFCLKKKN